MSIPRILQSSYWGIVCLVRLYLWAAVICPLFMSLILRKRGSLAAILVRLFVPYIFGAPEIPMESRQWLWCSQHSLSSCCFSVSPDRYRCQYLPGADRHPAEGRVPHKEGGSMGDHQCYVGWHTRADPVSWAPWWCLCGWRLFALAP